MPERFSIEPFTRMDKTILVRDSKGIQDIRIGFDDVDHDEVEEELPKLMAAMNSPDAAS